ncbi:hypothetical protein Q31b_20490 [Novipirellula aureliae]|uniref:Aerotolerance regulator N-terminal domain-containing protein n=1 Tax=Novipirellula aureliae TaxID=2527966 RepID=A0A5C6E3C0_9BACT|nr:BatA domain-containing protein [Novipirellula aureliae]TWU43014.1 hypothetical protein Q31b_20490 [Novipirellula aureliae]
MTFLNATLLFGLLAAAAPVALHLLSRREPQKVVFSSIRFLTQRYETNRSRLKIRRWWLLALRVAAIAAVALAFARPVIHQALSLTWLTIGLIALLGIGLLVFAGIAFSQCKPKALRFSLLVAAIVTLVVSLLWAIVMYATGTPPPSDSQSPVAMAIVIDNSPTSGWKTRNDDRTVRMHDLADWLVSRVPRTSRIAILDRSAAPPSFALDAASAIAQVEGTHPLAVTQPLEARIDAAIRLVRTSDLPSRTVVVISDLSELTWKGIVDDPTLSEQLAVDPTVALTVFDLGSFAATNRRLSAVNVSDSTPPASSPVAVTATVELDGEPASDQGLPVTAELEMAVPNPALPVVRDETIERPTFRVVDRASARISGNASSELVLNVPPLSVGTHHGRIRLVGNDPLSMDDIRYFTLNVLPASPILIVCDNQDEARVIGQTITTPFTIDDPNAEYRVEMIGYRDFDVVDLGDYDAVLLLDPANPMMQSERLGDFLKGGGGVLAALGPSASAMTNPTDVLPPIVRRWRVPSPGSFLQLSDSMHPAISPLTSVPGGVPWNEFRVYQYWQIRPQTFDRELAVYAGTEHPAMVERNRFATSQDANESSPITPGRLMLLTTPLPALSDTTRDWNELFSGTEAWPAFLLVRQVVDYLTDRNSEALTMQVGNAPTVSINTVDESRRNRLQLFPPEESSAVPIDVDSDATEVTLTNIRNPGTYWLRGDGFKTGFSANITEQATRLDRVDPEELRSAFSADHFKIVTNMEQIDWSGDSASQRVSLHSPAMLLALIVFLLEQILANRFYRRRQNSVSASSTLTSATEGAKR